jgi:predicted nucleic acid-binding protein
MKRQVLLDTNVVLDYTLKRPDFAENAEEIFRRIKTKAFVGCISSSAITDVYFIVESKTTSEYAWEMMEYIYQTLRILPVIRRTIRGALDSGMTDFEDAVQAAAAQDYGIDTVVTRDKEGFQNSDLRIYTPEEFLIELER